MSQEYVAAVVLFLGAILKVFGIDLESGVLEGLVAGGLALWIAIRRKQRGDINILGVKK